MIIHMHIYGFPFWGENNFLDFSVCLVLISSMLGFVFLATSGSFICLPRENWRHQTSCLFSLYVQDLKGEFRKLFPYLSNIHSIHATHYHLSTRKRKPGTSPFHRKSSISWTYWDKDAPSFHSLHSIPPSSWSIGKTPLPVAHFWFH